MKKKALALVLTGATAVSLLAGCGSAAQAPAGASSAAATTEAAAEETTAASEASSETSGAASTEAAADSTWPENVDLKASSYNEAAPDWTEYDQLITDIRTDLDLEDREAKMHQAEDMLMATGAVQPIYYYNDLYLENTAWSGDYATVFGTKYFQ